MRKTSIRTRFAVRLGASRLVGLAAFGRSWGGRPFGRPFAAPLSAAATSVSKMRGRTAEPKERGEAERLLRRRRRGPMTEGVLVSIT